jgi:hydantoinase/carbamoylase family amidase
VTTVLTQRLDQRIAELAAISDPGPGVTRPSFSPREREAHDLVAGWAAEKGGTATTDAAGNTILVFRPGEPYLLIGSHLDSVPCGGRYDGVAGVLAALEVAAALASEVELGLRAVVFAAEEGARFGTPCLGSLLATGELPDDALTTLRDAAGTTPDQAAADLGLRPADCAAWIREPAVAAFLEIHIEQGLELEAEGVRLGVVDVVAGCSRLALELTGRAEHSGATPMRRRADALAAAAAVALEVEAAGRSAREGVATIGRLDVEPNSATTIPGRVRATIDIRDVDAGRQRRTERRIRDTVETIAGERGIVSRLTPLSARDPVMLSAWPRRALAAACTDARVPFRILPSGAGHDAAVVARRAPAGMLFIATPGGISHSPDEDCRTEDIALAALVATEALRRLDREARAAGARTRGQ